VKVVDFGIAKAVGGDEAGQKVTKTGLVVGTPEFMSPEQLSGDTLDGRSDLYSLALVLYRMLTGKLPFEATTVQENDDQAADRRAHEACRGPARSLVPAGLQPVFDTALARTPMERYQSVAKFAGDIAAVTGRPVTNAVPQTDAQTQILDPTAGGATQRMSAKRPPPTGPSPAAAKKRPLLPAAIGLVVILAAGGAWVALSGGKKANGNPPDTSVVHDTAKQMANSQTNGGATRRGGTAVPVAPPPASSRINLARAKDALDDLFIDKLSSSTAAMVRAWMKATRPRSLCATAAGRWRIRNSAFG